MKRLILVVTALLVGGCVAISPEPPVMAVSRSLELIDLGTTHLRQAELDKAWAAFSLAHDIYPLPQAADGLGCVAFLRGDFLGAEAFFVKAHQMDESYHEAIGNLALLYEHLGYLDQAQELYQYVIDQNPDNFRARNNFAVFLKEQQLPAQARTHLLKAEASSFHPLVRNNLEQKL
jgi:tetratricopeptide (TPR) repeat protein